MKNKISFSSDIISYETVYTGTFGGDVKGMLLDGHLDNYTMQTNVLFVKNEYLYLLDSAKEKLRHSFKVTLRDVDGDSIPEIPSDECTTDAVWYESWFTFDAAKGLQKKATTVETYKQSYYLEVPETWKKSYGLQLSNDGLQMSVFWEKYRDDRKDTEQGINLEKSNLFQIIEENEQKLRGSGIFLSSDNGLAYWGILYDQSLFSTEELKKAFHLIKSEA